MQFFADLVHRYRITPYSHGDFRADHFLFENNKVATILSSYYYMNELHSLSFKWDVLPSLPGHTRNATIILGSGIAVSSSSANKPLAVRFASFVSSEEAQALLKLNVCSLPANRRVAENVEISNTRIHPPNYHAFVEFMPHSVPINQMGVSHSTLSDICRELTFLWANMETAEEACRRIEQKYLRPLVHNP